MSKRFSRREFTALVLGYGLLGLVILWPVWSMEREWEFSADFERRGPIFEQALLDSRTIATAVEAHVAKLGRPPQTLQSLVPDFLTRLPNPCERALGGIATSGEYAIKFAARNNVKTCARVGEQL